MNTADKKKEAFKQKVYYIYKEYRFLVWVGLATLLFSAMLTGHNIYTMISERDSTAFSIETIVDTPYAIDVQYGSSDVPLFAQVTGDLSNSELALISRGVSGYYGAELELYHMEEGVKLLAPASFYADGMLSRVDWDRTDRVAIVNYQQIPEVSPDIIAVNEWDIFEDDSQIIGNTLQLTGYVDAEATDTQAVQQLLGLIELMDDINITNSDASHDAYQLEFQHGDNQLHLHSDYPRIIGTVSRIAFHQINQAQ